MPDAPALPDTNALPATRRARFPNTIPRAITAVVVLGVLAYLVFVHAPAQRRDVIGEWEGRLRTMARLRGAAIGLWAEQGAAGALTVATFPSVLATLDGRREPAPRSAGTPDEAAHVHLDEVLDMFRRANRIDRVLLFDAGGTLRQQSPTGARPDPACVSAARHALATAATPADLHRHTDGTLAVAFHAIVRRGNAPAGARLGQVEVERTPSYWLYPLLTSDPTYTGTGEAVVFRLDGDETVALSPLRKSPAPPLTYRSAAPREIVDLLRGLVSGPVFLRYRDYSGASVFAAAEVVPHTEWGVVVKVDEREALQPYRARLWSAATTALALLLASGLVGNAIWRKRRQRWRSAAAAGEARLAVLLDNANDAILFVAADGRIRDVNRRAEQMYGRSRDALIGMEARNLRPEPLRSDVAAEPRRASAPTGYLFETEHLRGDGTAFPVEVSTRHVPVGNEWLFLSIVRDITERREAARAIERLGRLRDTLAAVHRAIVRETDAEDLFRECCRILVENNELRLAWVGRVDEPAGTLRPVAYAGAERDYVETVLIRTDDSPLGRGPSGEAVRSSAAVISNDTATDPRMAPWRDAQLARGFRSSAAFPIRTPGGVFGTLNVYASRRDAFREDVTALLQGLADDLGHAVHAIHQREHLRRTSQALQAIVDASPAAIYSIDAESRLLSWNRGAERIFGWRASEVLGRVLPIVAEADRTRFDELRARVMSGEAFSGVELSRVCRDGSQLEISVSAAPMTDAGGRVVGIMAIALDVTEANRNAREIARLNADLERRVAERTAQLQAANRELEAFTYSVSHDLRAPLRAIDGFGRILEEDHGAGLDAEGRRLLGVVRNNTRRMDQLIDDLLAFSRAGRVELDRTQVDVAGLARAAFDEVVPPAARDRIRFTVDALPSASGDRSLLGQVLTNLISNAVKFSAPRERPAIHVGFEATAHGGAYFVRDNGVGFDTRFSDKLFGVFQRLHSSRDFEGTGVGLALVERILRRHGARIWADSTPGDGATFWFTLPGETPDAGS